MAVNTSHSPEWFKDWFNSYYYHLLYCNRNEEEASAFIKNLTSVLGLQTRSRIWDIACGKGRHAIEINKLGYTVVGTDLSENSINEALRNASASLDFYVHDMRTPFRINYFDASFNLFTSIGYFDNYNDNFKVFTHVYNALVPGGVFVIDFFNACKVEATLVKEAVIVRGDVEFQIKKRIEDYIVIKLIEFEAEGRKYMFEEKVSLLKKNDFCEFESRSGFIMRNVFGDYAMQPFNEALSDRLILVFEKQSEQ